MNWIQEIHQLRRRGLALALLATALPGFAQDASLLQYEGADREQKVLAAARKEGTLTLYTSLAADNLQA